MPGIDYGAPVPSPQQPATFISNLGTMLVDELTKALENKEPLEEKIQSVFAYHPMNCPSFLVLDAWVVLKELGLYQPNEIAQALQTGTFKDYFLQLLEQANDKRVMQVKIQYDELFWDEEMLDYCKGVGLRVILSGLTSAKGQLLNGQEGIITGNDGQRFHVSINNQMLNIKSENLYVKQ